MPSTSDIRINKSDWISAASIAARESLSFREMPRLPGLAAIQQSFDWFLNPTTRVNKWTGILL